MNAGAIHLICGSEAWVLVLLMVLRSGLRISHRGTSWSLLLPVAFASQDWCYALFCTTLRFDGLPVADQSPSQEVSAIGNVALELRQARYGANLRGQPAQQNQLSHLMSTTPVYLSRKLVKTVFVAMSSVLDTTWWL